MGLSQDLISQFVKVTKDDSNNIRETTVFGTTVEQNGKMYVQLDGSELLTPVIATADTMPGERVSVMIKNHTATVTGNFSSPAARTADVQQSYESISAESARINTVIADVVRISDTLTAETGRINTLITDNATIRENLTADRADIDTLQAEDVRINEQLTANKASIQELTSSTGTFEDLTTQKFEAIEAEINKLEAGEITVEQLKATFATIAQLDAEKGRITDLEAEVGNIDTLIFGSATGSTIQTSFANAVIAQLGNAQIKSAMIQAIAADKITSGDIITDNVRVKSQNGLLLISDETIQISDNSRVRVQIGKDSTNDYSINIWDADGNLMFSKGGITDNAIKEAIIRNDMVSDTANIAAHKLDIDSLFEELNGSSNTIKSTRIYLDDKAQTLDVAFEAMTSDIDELGESVTSQGTMISTMQGQISSKIWQEDINTAKSDLEKTTSDLTTKYTSLDQSLNSVSATVVNHTSQINEKADSSTVTEVNDKVTQLEADLDGFETTVRDTYVTQAEFDDLSIGGRNLLKYSRHIELQSNNAALYPVTKEKLIEDGREFYRYSRTETSLNPTTMSLYSAMPVTQLTEHLTGKQMTFSFLIRSSHNIDITTMNILFLDGTSYTWSPSNVWHAIGSKWVRVVVTATIEQEYEWTSGAILRFNPLTITIPEGEIENFYIDVCEWKIEKGNRVTDWTPAPEDLEAKVAVNETNIAQTDNALTAVASRVTETEKNISTLQQTANSLTTRISEVDTSLEGLQIGGRNLFAGFDESEIQLNDYYETGSFMQFANRLTFNPCETVGETYTISFWAKSPNGPTKLQLYNQNGQPRHFYFTTTLTQSLGTEWEYFTYTFTNVDNGEEREDTSCNRIEIYAANQLGVLVKKIKVEKGDYATDWTPAPEDMATEASVINTQAVATDHETRITEAESVMQQLSNMFSTLIVDSSGGTLMTQDGDNWSFNMGNYEDALNTIASDLDTLISEVGSTQSVVDILQQAVSDLGIYSDYIHIKTYNSQPCIELGETDSDFKTRITNTEIQFMDGTTIPAYVSNKKLYIERAEVTEELQQGGFVWKVRDNGNLGLMWIGGDS